MNVNANVSDVKHPIGLNITVTIENVSYELFSTYNLLSTTERNTFPHVECSFLKST